MVLLPPLHVPPMPSRHTAKNRLSLDCVSSWPARHPIQKRLPYLFYFFRTQIVAHHQQVEHIVSRNLRVLTPVMVEKIFPIEPDEVAQQTPKSVIGSGLHLKNRCTPKFRQFLYAQRHSAHCAECSSSPALQRPEQIWVRTCIREAYFPICGDYFRLQQSRRRGSIMLRKTSETSALNQARHADRSAAAALHIRAALCRYRVVGLHPNRTRAQRHCALWGMPALASLWNKCFMHGDVVHAPRPHQQRIRRV